MPRNAQQEDPARGSRISSGGAAGRPPLLYLFSLFLVAAVALLLLAGGLVTSRKAGLAVPDWPLSYGRLFPPMVGNIFWEHGHRMIAAAVGILTIVFAVLLQIFQDHPPAGARRALPLLGWVAVGAVLIQALLGGLTVKFLLPPAVSIAHACLAQTFFCLTAAIAYFLSPYYAKRASAPAAKPSPKSLRLFDMTTGFIYLQLILGAVIRHTGHAVTAHILVAFLVAIHVILVMVRVLRFYPGQKVLVRFAVGLPLLTAVQISLGMGSFIFTRVLASGGTPSLPQVLFTAAHQTTGALVLAAGFLITLLVRS